MVCLVSGAAETTSRRHVPLHCVDVEVTLIIIDEIHLLGADRGPIIEVIVSRMRHMSQFTNRKVRVIGLSTALANAQDLSDWYVTV